jgi:RimJ/RimL family protein N-acetyltransferase
LAAKGKTPVPAPAPAQQNPRLIRLETPHYVVRTLERADALDGLRNWMTDADAVRNLNARPAVLSKKELDDYIKGFDGVTSHLLGIFEKETGALVGVRAIYVHPQLREFLVNVLVGEREARGKGARSESRDVMYRYFFEDMDMLAARCSVLSTNEPVLRIMDRNGWVRERTQMKPAASGQGFVELREFRLTRDVWRRKTAEQAAASST